MGRAEWARRSGERSSRLGAECGGSGSGRVTRCILQAFIPRFDSCTSSVVRKEAVTCASFSARSMLPEREIFA